MHIVNAEYADIMKKVSVLPRNANAVLTSMFVRAEKSPIKIMTN
jgi:hypothetical protein